MLCPRVKQCRIDLFVFCRCVASAVVPKLLLLGPLLVYKKLVKPPKHFKTGLYIYIYILLCFYNIQHCYKNMLKKCHIPHASALQDTPPAPPQTMCLIEYVDSTEMDSWRTLRHRGYGLWTITTLQLPWSFARPLTSQVAITGVLIEGRCPQLSTHTHAHKRLSALQSNNVCHIFVCLTSWAFFLPACPFDYDSYACLFGFVCNKAFLSAPVSSPA